MTTPPLCDHLLVGVSGSIHSLHIHTYLSSFRESFAGSIKVIMTESARRMVAPRTIELYADDRVFTDLWDRSATVDRAPHVQLTRWADLFIIIPATANVLGKAAHGIADDLLSTAILTCGGPAVFAPAMNPSMWESKAVQRNVRNLKEDGHYIVPPDSAVSVTSGQWDVGLAPSLETVLLHLQHVRMKGLKEDYWEEATREKPLTPAQKKIREMVAASAQAAADAP